MQNANELLSQILQVVGKIEANQRGSKKAAATGGPGPTTGMGDGSIATKLGPAVKSFTGVGPKATKTFFSFLRGMLDIAEKSKDKNVKKMKVISDSLNSLGGSLPSVAEGLNELGRIRAKQVKMAIWSLEQLYEFMEEAGDNRSARKVDRAIKTFDKMGKSLKNIAKPIKDISLSFAYLGLGILALAGSLLLTTLIIGLSKPTDVLWFLGGLIIGVLLMFGLLALASKIVDKGTDVIRDIGIGMVALSLGILAFAVTMILVPKILGNESGGSIIKSMLMIIDIVAAMALVFMILGKMKKFTFQGFMTTVWMTAGLIVLSIGILALAATAKILMTGMTAPSAAKDEKDEGKRAIIKGLGTIALIILAEIALFAMLGIPGFSTILKSGAITMILMSGALYLMAESVKKLVEVGKFLGGEDIAGTLSYLIGGTIDGFLGGLSSLSGGKKGVAGVTEFIKNSAQIFAGTGVLMAMSLALSMFAKAITAFAELENMRIIEGYDKDGKPIFGEKVNLTKVSDNINTSISTFLEALIKSTDGLTRDKAAAIGRMSQALTGRRGILTAVIQFADALKVYAEFGENNEIGYVDYDDKGKEIRKKVSANKVVDNMIGSFLYFTERMFSSSEKEFGDGEESQAGMSVKQKRRVQRMAKALTGKNGILGAVVQFSEVLRTFAEYGENNELPVLDADGKPVMEGGKQKTISMDKIATNIVESLITFSDTLADKLDKKTSVKDASKSLSKYEGMINQLNKLSSSMDSLSKMSASVQNLADGIGDLAVNIEKLDADKLTDILKRIANGSLEISTATKNYSGVTATATSSSSSSKETPTTTKTGEPKWDVIAAQIGLAVGQQITDAVKKGQIKFEFSGVDSNKGILEIR